jgi:hypothetical protein
VHGRACHMQKGFVEAALGKVKDEEHLLLIYPNTQKG